MESRRFPGHDAPQECGEYDQRGNNSGGRASCQGLLRPGVRAASGHGGDPRHLEGGWPQPGLQQALWVGPPRVLSTDSR